MYIYLNDFKGEGVFINKNRMKHVVYKNVYVGMNIRKTDALILSQESIRSKYSIIPRDEFHVTIAYFNEVAFEDIELLGNLLSSIVTGVSIDIKLSGIGGVYEEINGTINEIFDRNRKKYLDSPRVFWWSVILTKELREFRNLLINFAVSLNLTSEYLAHDYFPHITIGSIGPIYKEFVLWDVHSIPKKPTLKNFAIPLEVIVDKIHITNIKINPESLFLVS